VRFAVCLSRPLWSWTLTISITLSFVGTRPADADSKRVLRNTSGETAAGACEGCIQPLCPHQGRRSRLDQCVNILVFILSIRVIYFSVLRRHVAVQWKAVCYFVPCCATAATSPVTDGPAWSPADPATAVRRRSATSRRACGIRVQSLSISISWSGTCQSSCYLVRAQRTTSLTADDARYAAAWLYARSLYAAYALSTLHAST
jgi:hypothetical protein